MGDLEGDDINLQILNVDKFERCTWASSILSAYTLQMMLFENYHSNLAIFQMNCVCSVVFINQCHNNYRFSAPLKEKYLGKESNKQKKKIGPWKAHIQ